MVRYTNTIIYYSSLCRAIIDECSYSDDAEDLMKAWLKGTANKGMDALKFIY